MDTFTAEILRQLALPRLQVIALETLEAWATELASAKADRSRIEYYFTLTPYLPLFCFFQEPDLDLVTYLDADLFFYSTPQPLFDELGSKSILAIEHRYSPHLREKEVYGRFNVQFLSFRRDAIGLQCLERWRSQCLAWCHDRLEDGKYGDQKYLDEWPQLYGDALAIARHPGAGVAPWNWAATPMKWLDDAPHPAGHRLIFFHFHGVKIANRHLLSTGLLDWGLMPRRLTRWFYAGYLRWLRSTADQVFERTGRRISLQDKLARGPGLRIDTLAEVLRKLFAQLLLVP